MSNVHSNGQAVNAAEEALFLVSLPVSLCSQGSKHICYTTHMNQPIPPTERKAPRSQKLLNKTFYRFVFSFVAVVAGVLLFILALGISANGVQ